MTISPGVAKYSQGTQLLHMRPLPYNRQIPAVLILLESELKVLGPMHPWVTCHSYPPPLTWVTGHLVEWNWVNPHHTEKSKVHAIPSPEAKMHVFVLIVLLKNNSLEHKASVLLLSCCTLLIPPSSQCSPSVFLASSSSPSYPIYRVPRVTDSGPHLFSLFLQGFKYHLHPDDSNALYLI